MASHRSILKNGYLDRRNTAPCGVVTSVQSSRRARLKPPREEKSYRGDSGGWPKASEEEQSNQLCVPIRDPMGAWPERSMLTGVTQ